MPKFSHQAGDLHKETTLTEKNVPRVFDPRDDFRWKLELLRDALTVHPQYSGTQAERTDTTGGLC